MSLTQHAAYADGLHCVSEVNVLKAMYLLNVMQLGVPDFL